MAYVQKKLPLIHIRQISDYFDEYVVLKALLLNMLKLFVALEHDYEKLARQKILIQKGHVTAGCIATPTSQHICAIFSSSIQSYPRTFKCVRTEREWQGVIF